MWLRRTAALLLGVSAQSQAANAQLSPVDSSPAIRQVLAAETEFLSAWRVAWLETERAKWQALQERVPRHRNPRYSDEGQRFNRCAYAWKPPLGMDRPDRLHSYIPAPMPDRFSHICPQWVVDVPPDPDASVVLDSALFDEKRVSIAAQRDSLLSLMRRVAQQVPHSVWLLGQRVRLLVDQGYRSAAYLQEAVAVARACGGDAWWCASLEGYAWSRIPQLDSASAAFARARTVASDAMRCQSDDALVLMERRSAPREALTAARDTTCVARANRTARFWWLSDPLWSDSVNERRVEHDARTVRLVLAAALPKSEQFDWVPKHPEHTRQQVGAVVQLVTRYGWPSKMFWRGENERRREGSAANGRTAEYIEGVTPLAEALSPPGTTQEYTRNRLRVTPSWPALLNPLRATAADWEFSAPPEDSAKFWWPGEHFVRDRPLIALEAWQVQQWRRGDSVLVVAAVERPMAWLDMVARNERPAFRVTGDLIVSAGPDRATPIAHIDDGDSDVLRFAGTTSRDSTVLSIELRAAPAKVGDARARFGLGVDAALWPAEARTLGVSAPALLQLPVSGDLPQTAPDIAPLLRSGTTLRDVTHIGLYWETYGAEAIESVETELHVERLSTRGIFERITVALGGSERPMEGTRIRWREADAGTRLDDTGSGNNVYGRALAVNIDALQPGDYAVTVTLRAADGRQGSAYRLFRVASNRSRGRP